MGRMIKLKIDVTKLDKTRFFKAQSGAIYADLVMYENDTPDQYGNDWFIKIDSTKEDRAAGTKLPYVGNGKNIGGGQSAAPAAQQSGRRPAPAAATEPDPDSEIPF